MTAGYVGVRLLDAPYHIDREYAYYLPLPLSGCVRVGSIVAVPFSGANRRSYAVVTSLSGHSDMDRVKPVLAVLPDRFSLGEEMLGLCFFLHKHTLCAFGDAVRCVVPAAVFTAITEYYTLGAVAPNGEVEAAVCRLVAEDGRETRDALLTLTAATPTLLSRMVEEDKLCRAYEVKEEKGKTEKYVDLACPDGEILSLLNGNSKQKIRGEAQERILRTLLANGRMRRADLCDITHTSTAQVAGLVKRGILREEDLPVVRDPYADLKFSVDKSEILLSRAQNTAYGSLLSLYEENKPKAALLHGVTGSGKTKVMMKVIDRVIADGKSVIVMVPEIALTPQTVGLFCARYGKRVAVIHSLLSDGERFDAWCRAAAGELDLIIGTRSAVFAPFPNLGLVIMDEEHEHTYKSESDPKYHTRDVAAYRCGVHNALLILASATPSLESYYKAERGQYTLVPLKERYGGATLPTAEVVDMREELRAGNRSPISRRLLELLEENSEREEQSILFLNRRGYNTSLSCKECGEPITCPHCSAALTYHTDRTGGSLFCHICGYRTAPLRACPACGGEHISYIGFGTQKAEGELSACLPAARVLRMDADTTAGKGAYDKLLHAFRAREADILLGTQMVTKGHDFPAVSLVGVLLADTSLYVNDFRAAEHTFSQLTQVIGRAGRAEAAGRAVIQTYTPYNEAIRLAIAQDYESFYHSEIELRRTLSFPPFCDIVQLTVSSQFEDELLTAALYLAESMKTVAEKDYPDLPLVIFGPFEAGVYKAAGRFRLRMMVKCRLNKNSRAYFSRIMIDFMQHLGRRVGLSLDTNPM